MGDPSSTARMLRITADLNTVLESIATSEETLVPLYTRRDQLIDALQDRSLIPTSEAKVQRVAKAEPEAEKVAIDIDLSEPEVVEKKLTQEEAMALYDAAIPKASAAQGRMIFALLGGEHKIKDEEQKKEIIKSIIAEQHDGEVLDSITDLSKVWAGDLITYLQKTPTVEVLKHLKEPF